MSRVLGWVRANLFSSVPSAIATLAIAWLAFKLIPPFVDWAFLEAIWSAADSQACRQAKGEGACWAFIAEKHRFIFFGTYPYDQHWRPAGVIALLLSLYALSAWRRTWHWWLAIIWACGLAAIGVLMWGGVPGLPYVENGRWGGLALTLLLATFGLAFAFPLSILLALGRRSELPLVRAFCIAYIELIRGVPIITFLFMASVMFPLFVPEGFTVDKLLRAQIAFVLVIAAYLAEVIRGGLQAIPAGQHEAAASMGLNYWQATLLIVLPQAVRMTIPALVNTFIAFFKDTSLVAIVGLFDLLGAAKAVNVDPKWFGFSVEVYLFAGAVYFVFCYAVSQYTQRLERILKVAAAR